MSARKSTRGNRFVEAFVGPYGMRAVGEYDWEGGNRMIGQMGPFTPPFLREREGGALEMGSGFHRDIPPGSLKYNPKKQKPLRDFEEHGSYWCISQRALNLLEQHAAPSIDVMPVHVTEQRPGEPDVGVPHWFCDVVRFEDCIDEAASEIAWSNWAGLQTYDRSSKRLVVSSDFDRESPLFRLARAPRRILCSDDLMKTIKSAGLSGIKFQSLDCPR